MKLKTLACVAVAAVLPKLAYAQDTIRIGVIAALSGPFTNIGKPFEDGIKTFMQQHGDQVAGKKIEIIYRDDGSINAEMSKCAAQELIAREKVSFLIGFSLTPSALAVAPIAIPGQNTDDRHERGHYRHHCEVPVHAPHRHDDAADDRAIRHLDRQEQPFTPPASRTARSLKAPRAHVRMQPRARPPCAYPKVAKYKGSGQRQLPVVRRWTGSSRSRAWIDVSSRSPFTLIDEGSCFAGTLLEIALSADRINEVPGEHRANQL